MIHSFFATIPVFIILAWLIFFIFGKNKSNTERYLILSLSVALIVCFILWHYLKNSQKGSPILDSIWVFTSLSVYPLYYYYVRLLTVDNKAKLKRWSLLLLPAFTMALFTASIYYRMTPEEIEIFTSKVLYGGDSQTENYSSLINLQKIRMELFEVIFTIEVLLTALFGLSHIIKYGKKKIIPYYSNLRNREMSQITVPFLFLMMSTVFAIISNIVGVNLFINSTHLLAFPSAIHIIIFCAVWLANYSQDTNTVSLFGTQSGNGTKGHNNPHDKSEHGDLGDKCDELFVQMEDLLKQKQYFRNPYLRLNDLAETMGTNRTYVSQLIRQNANSNFSTYINKHRIEYAKNLLSSDENIELTIDEIASESGFSSQSSFYRVFANFEKTSPAKYRIEQNNKGGGKVNNS